MRPVLLLAVPVTCVLACSDTTQPVSSTPPRIEFATTALSDGAVSGIACYSLGGITNEWYESGTSGHFDTLAVARTDTGGNPDVCGSLQFNDRVRGLELGFAVAGSEDYPYYYLWRYGRGIDVPDSTTQLWAATDSLYTWQQTGVSAMPLWTGWDGVGAVLILHDQPLQVTDSAFLFGSNVYGPVSKIEYALQHWREILAPLLDSARVEATAITLWWRNRHSDRPIDSTIVFRDGQERVRLGPAAQTWTDTGVPQGWYTYRLKHWTRPVVWHEGQLAYPNSTASDSITVQVDTATPPPSVVIDGPAYITKPRNYTWTLDITGTSPFTYAWWLKPFGPGSEWQLVDTTSSYTRYVGYSDLGFQLRADVTDPSQQLGADTVAVSTAWGYRPLPGGQQ